MAYPTSERAELIHYLDKTRDDLVAALADLSLAQLNFQISPQCWSIGGVVEHIALVEDAVITKVLQEIASAPSVTADGKKNVTDIFFEEGRGSISQTRSTWAIPSHWKIDGNVTGTIPSRQDEDC
jgi:uncharacterized damage-inducible protein DinB